MSEEKKSNQALYETLYGGSLVVGLVVENLPAVQGTLVQSLGLGGSHMLRGKFKPLHHHDQA